MAYRIATRRTCAAAAISMMHLSRFSEELVLDLRAKFQFIDRQNFLHRQLNHAAEENP
jgi:argininosuccinate lyase